MQPQDYSRMRNAIKMAIDTLESEAKCYGYREEPEHTKLITYLQNYREELKKQYQAWERGFAEQEKEPRYKEPYVITDEQIKDFQKTLTFYRVCRIRCNHCGDVLEHTFHTKDAPSCRMRWCSCGKTALDPHPIAYRILGDDYEDLSEKWDEEK